MRCPREICDRCVLFAAAARDRVGTTFDPINKVWPLSKLDVIVRLIEGSRDIVGPFDGQDLGQVLLLRAEIFILFQFSLSLAVWLRWLRDSNRVHARDDLLSRFHRRRIQRDRGHDVRSVAFQMDLCVTSHLVVYVD